MQTVCPRTIDGAMLGSHNPGQPPKLGCKEREIALSPPPPIETPQSGMAACLLKHPTSLHIFTSQSCPSPLSGEPAGARPSQITQSESSLLWTGTGKS